MKRGRAEGVPEPSQLKRVNSSHSTLVARVYSAYISNGGTRADFVTLFETAGYDLPYSTLSRWVRGVKDEGGGAVRRGQARSQKQAVAGAKATSFHEKTTLADIQQFCAEFFDTEASEASASRWMAELGFASRKMQAKTAGYQVDVDSSIEMAFSWLAKHHNDFNPSSLWSIDSLFTGHRTDTHKSFVVSGGRPANFSGSISTYTALGITCICGDGRYYPMILFTHNPLFNRNVNPTKRRKAMWKRVDDIFEKYKIDKSRVVFVPQQPGKKAKSIVPATKARVADFFSHYEIEKGAIILSDGGDEFANLEELGFARHIYYPGPVHQHLSPNDNKLHGDAKRRWRSKKIDFKDDAEALISLLHFTDEAHAGVESWFEANLQVNSMSLSKEQVANLIRGGRPDKLTYYQECRRFYRYTAGLDPRGEYKDRLPDELDGVFWA